MKIAAGSLCRVKDDNNSNIYCYVMAVNVESGITFCEVIPVIVNTFATKQCYKFNKNWALYMPQVFVVVADVLETINSLPTEQCEEIANLHIAMHLDKKEGIVLKYGELGHQESLAVEYFPTLENFDVHHMYSGIIQGYFFKE